MKNRPPNPDLNRYISPATIVFWLLLLSFILYGFGAGIPFLLTSIVTLFFALHPVLSIEQSNIRKYQLVEMSLDSHPVGNKIIDLIEKSGTRKKIKIFISGRSDINSPFAFSTFSKGFLVIPTWLLKEYESYPDEYDAIIVHEISHIKFGDTWKKDLSQSLALNYLGMLAFFLFFQTYQIYWFMIDPNGWESYTDANQQVSLPLTLFSKEYQSANTIADDWFGKHEPLYFSAIYYWYFTLIFLAGYVVFISLRILSQSRELYADAFASRVKGVQILKRAFGVIAINSLKIAAKTRKSNKKNKSSSLLERLLSFHPPAIERLKSLTDTKYIVNYHLQVSFLGGLIAEIANWQALFQSKSFISENRSAGFILPFAAGVLLSFFVTSYSVASNIDSWKKIIYSVIKNSIIYSFGVVFIHITLIIAYALGFRMYENLHGDLYINSSILFWYFYVFQSIAVYIFLLPATLIVSGLIISVVKRHYIRVSVSVISYYTRISLISVILNLAIWNGLINPTLAILGFSSLKWGLFIWIGTIFLIVLWSISLIRKKVDIECKHCNQRVVLQAGQYQCPNCNQVISQWAFEKEVITKT